MMKTGKAKRLLSLTLAVLIACMSFQTLTFAGGEAEETKVQPNWLSEEEAADWWNWDWQFGSNDENRFGLSFGDGSVSVTPNFDWVTDLTHPGASYTLDLNETPYLYYDISMQLTSNVRLLVDDSNSGVEIIPNFTGNRVGKIKLADVATLQPSITDNKLVVHGLAFTPSGDIAGKAITINGFYFGGESLDPQPQENRVNPNWMSSAETSSWWNWDWQFDSNDENRFGLSFGGDGSVTVTPNFDWVTSITHPGASYTLDLSKTPYLYYDLSLQLTSNVKLLVDDSNSGVELLPSFTGDSVGKIKLADVAALQPYITDNKLVVHGFAFDPISGIGSGKGITINGFYFDDVGMEPHDNLVNPKWISPEETSSWWNWDWQFDSNDENRFGLSFGGDGSVTVTPNFDWVTSITHPGASYTLDLSKTPYLYYDLSLQLTSNVKLLVDDSNSGVELLPSFTGDSVGKIKLADVAALQPYITDNKLVVHGFAFDPISGIGSGGITIKSFYFADTTGDLPGDAVIYPAWLTESNINNWWSWDWNHADGDTDRFAVSVLNNGSAKIGINWNLSDVEDVKCVGDSYTLDISKTTHLYYDFDSQFALKEVRLILGDTNNDGVALLSNLPVGRSQGVIALADNETLKSHIQDNKLTVRGIVLRTIADNATGKEITINTFDFAPEGMVYPASRPEAPGIALSNATQEQVTVTVNAPASAQRVQYKLGTGAFQEYGGSFTLTENTKVYARYFTEDGFWSRTASFHVLSIGAQPGYNVIYPNWLTEAEYDNWWSWNWNTGTGDGTRFILTYPENGSVNLKYAGPFNDIKMLGDTYTLDLNVTPYFCYNILSEFPTDLRLIVRSGEHEGVAVLDSFQGENKGYIDLRTVPGLENYIIGSQLTVMGFTFRQTDADAEAGLTNGKTLNIRALDFAGEEKIYPDERPQAPSFTLNTEDPTDRLLVTVNAPADAQAVWYKFGDFGEYQRYSGPVEAQKNIPVYAKYFSEDGFWSVEGTRTINNIIVREPSLDAQPVIPNWFEPAQKKLWYNWDWQVDKNDEKRFTIDYKNDIWLATIYKDYAKSLSVNQNNPDAPFLLNLVDNNALHYKIDTSVELDVYLRVSDVTDRKFDSSKDAFHSVYLGKIPAGKNADAFSLLENLELLSLSNENYDIQVVSVEFVMSPYAGSTIEVERFLFDDIDNYYEGYPDTELTVIPITPNWFGVSNLGNWTDGDVFNGSPDAKGKFSVAFSDDNDWTADFGDSRTILTTTNPLNLHLMKNNTLYYQIHNTTSTTLSLLVRADGQIVTVPLLSLRPGDTSDSVSLNDNAQLKALGPRLTLMGVSLTTEKSGRVTVERCILDKPGQDYPDFPDDAQIAADKAAAAFVVDAINQIGEVTLDKTHLIIMAREYYNALTPAQKAYVVNFGLLVNAEGRLDELMMQDTSGEIMNSIPTQEILDFMTQNPGRKVIINLNQGAVISPEILQKALATNSDIVVKVIDPDTRKIDYILTIFSENILDPSKALDTRLFTEKDDVWGLEDFQSSQTSYLGLNLYEADMGVKLNLSISTSSSLFPSLSGVKKAYIYRFDEQREEYLLVAKNVTVSDGMLSFDTLFSGMYVMSTELRKDVAPDTENTQQSGGDQSGGNHKTGDSSGAYPWVLALLAGFSACAALLLKRREAR